MNIELSQPNDGPVQWLATVKGDSRTFATVTARHWYDAREAAAKLLRVTDVCSIECRIAGQKDGAK